MCIHTSCTFLQYLCILRGISDRYRQSLAHCNNQRTIHKNLPISTEKKNCIIGTSNIGDAILRNQLGDMGKTLRKSRKKNSWSRFSLTCERKYTYWRLILVRSIHLSDCLSVYLNAIKSVLADVLSISPSSKRRGYYILPLCQCR